MVDLSDRRVGVEEIDNGNGIAIRYLNTPGCILAVLSDGVNIQREIRILVCG